MASCKKGTKKVKGRCVPNKGCKFVKNGGGRVSCKSGGSSKKRSTKRRRGASCGAGLKKGKGGRCVLKKGYRYAKRGGGRTVRARAA